MRTRLLGAFALVALLGAGCSSGAADDVDVGAGNGAAAVHEQAVAFATCMRGHGVVEFPDPEPSGELTIDAIANGSSVDAGSATFEQLGPMPTRVEVAAMRRATEMPSSALQRSSM